MKMRLLFFLIIVFIINCPGKYKPDVESIEVIYLSSLYDDVLRAKPYLSGIKTLPGIKVGHLKTDPAFLSIILGRLGFYELLNNTGIDFVIMDSLPFQADNINYFLIPKAMGYAIKNCRGIRFAILRKDRDSLTIDDEIQITLIRQRSDVLWIIENELINIAPVRINFFIKDRGLTDTTMTRFNIEPDSVILTRLQAFKEKLDQTLDKKTYLEGKSLEEYILAKTAHDNKVDIILYPGDMFVKDIKQDSVSLREILSSIVSEMTFVEKTLDKKQVETMRTETKYKIYGNIQKDNRVLMPGPGENYLFDLFYNL